MFVLATTGLAPLVRRELAALPGVSVTDVGNDGRADVVLCEVEAGRERGLLSLRTVEDVFVEVGRTLRSEGDRPPWIARRLVRPARLAGGVRVWQSQSRDGQSRDGQSRDGRQGGGRSRDGRSREGRPGTGRTRRSARSGPMTYRVVARVLQERTWQRTQLRRALSESVSAAEPGWQTADPARLELWAIEYTKGCFVAGVRLTTVRMRQHGGRTSERPGALRPTVAAAMVALAGESQSGGLLLDPCCGSGTILAEAMAGGWRAVGRDIDQAAVSASRRNVSRADVEIGDVRDLDLADASVAACVSNLPFGRQYDVQGEPRAWLAGVLTELARVTKPGGRIVLLVPDVAKSAIPARLRLHDRHSVRLLGTTSTIWMFERR